MKQISYQPQGTCSKLINIEADDQQHITDLKVIGGCHGNLQGIAALVKGMPLKEAKERLQGIRCGNKPTSCPDQISKAIAELEKDYL